MTLGFAVLALLAGLVLVLLELVVPSFGTLGFLAAGALVTSVVLGFQAGPTAGIGMLAASIVLVPATLWFGARAFPQTPIGRRMILSGPVTDVSGGAVPPASASPPVGRRGVTTSPLRPSGVALFDGERVPVVSESAWVPADTPVEVVQVEGIRVVVRPVSA
ncbi:MAG: hypothetical protein L0216_17820 [Planctomycetales bacterium]|nr:hypothetical protein [Planctomycetales bacterium]